MWICRLATISASLLPLETWLVGGTLVAKKVLTEESLQSAVQISNQTLYVSMKMFSSSLIKLGPASFIISLSLSLR